MLMSKKRFYFSLFLLILSPKSKCAIVIKLQLNFNSYLSLILQGLCFCYLCSIFSRPCGTLLLARVCFNQTPGSGRAALWLPIRFFVSEMVGGSYICMYLHLPVHHCICPWYLFVMVAFWGMLSGLGGGAGWTHHHHSCCINWKCSLHVIYCAYAACTDRLFTDAQPQKACIKVYIFICIYI